MSRLRTRQLSRFILVSALTFALTLPAAAQRFDRLDLASRWQAFLAWLRPEGPPPPPSGKLEVEVQQAGAGRDPDGAAVPVEPPPPQQAAGASVPGASNN